MVLGQGSSMAAAQTRESEVEELWMGGAGEAGPAFSSPSSPAASSKKSVLMRM